MSSSKTVWNSYAKSASNFKLVERFKYFFSHGFFYRLKDWFSELQNKTNFHEWKRPVILKTIDLLYNSFVIGLTAYSLLNNNWFVKGFGVTLFFILLKSYVSEFRELFIRRR